MHFVQACGMGEEKMIGHAVQLVYVSPERQLEERLGIEPPPEDDV